MNPRKLAVLLVCLLLVMQIPAQACGPFFDELDFTYSLHPDIPLSKFAAGNLGVLQASMARSYLVVAWRNLNGVPLSAQEQKVIIELWKQRLNVSNEDKTSQVNIWNSVRKKFGVTSDSNVYPEKNFSGVNSYFGYVNCPNSAFEFAAQTAEKLGTQFGADSKELKDWINAQDKVFCNCSGYEDKAQMPAPLQAGLSAALRPYRDYQIACANFYAGNYDAAKQQFLKIAQDAASPFKSYGAYLALRASVRKATVAEKTDNALLVASENEAKQLLNNNKSDSDIQSALHSLLQFIQFKINPKETFVELTRQLSTGNDALHAADHLCDYTLLFDNMVGDTDAGPGDTSNRKIDPATVKFIQDSGDLSDWVMNFQAIDPDSGKHAISKWQQTHKVAWLIAALQHTKIKDPACAQLLADAKKIGRDSPAYQHIQYSISAHLMEEGKPEEARKSIEAIVSDKSIDIGPSSRNLFVDLHLEASKDYSDFLSWALQRPACVDDAWAFCELPRGFDKMEASKTYKQLDPAFSPAVSKFFNSAVPLNLLCRILDIPGMPARLKGDVLQALWVRAYLLQDNKTQQILSAKLKQAIPSLVPMLAAYDKATSPEEKSFAGAFMLLRNPGMRPCITTGYGRRTEINKIDDYQDNWWQQQDISPAENKADQPADMDAFKFVNCLGKEERLQGGAENKKIIDEGLAPSVLSKSVLSFARSNPQDPRLPEALSLCVRATHFGERNGATSKFSKECFVVLHNKYPKSPWTAKTKYYY